MFIYRRRVQFYETDAQGIVHHSNYFRYFEEARGELLRSLGYPYSKLRDEGIDVVLLSANCEFIKPLRYDEEFEIELTLLHLDRFTFSFQYLLRSSETIKAKGSTKHCTVKEGKICSIPTQVKERLIQFFSSPCKHS